MATSTNIGCILQRQDFKGLEAAGCLAALVMALAALLLTLALSSTIEPSNAEAQKKMPYTFFLTTTNCLAIRTTPPGSGITMANPLQSPRWLEGHTLGQGRVEPKDRRR